MMRPRKKFYKRPSLIAATVILILALITVPTALVLTARAQTDPVPEPDEKSRDSSPKSPANGEHISARTLMKGTRIVRRERLFYSPRLHFAPDNVTLATLDVHDQALCLWNTDNSKLLFRLESHKTMCGPLLFTPDASILAVGCRKAEVELWDVAAGKLLKTLKHNKRRDSQTSCLAVSPDGMTLAAATHDTIGLWDVPDGKLRRTMSGHSTVIEEMVFTPDGGAIVSGEDSGIIKWWDTQTGTLTKTLPQRPEWVGIIAFSPSAKTMATGRDFGLTLWDMESGKLLRQLTKGGYYVGVFSADGKTLVQRDRVRHNTAALTFWDVQTGKKKQALTLPDVICNHTPSVAMSPQGNILAAGDETGTIRLWCIEESQRHGNSNRPNE